MASTVDQSSPLSSSPLTLGELRAKTAHLDDSTVVCVHDCDGDPLVAVGLLIKTDRDGDSEIEVW